MTFEVASQSGLKKDKFKSGMSVFSIVTLAEIINQQEPVNDGKDE